MSGWFWYFPLFPAASHLSASRPHRLDDMCNLIRLNILCLFAEKREKFPFSGMASKAWQFGGWIFMHKFPDVIILMSFNPMSQSSGDAPQQQQVCSKDEHTSCAIFYVSFSGLKLMAWATYFLHPQLYHHRAQQGAHKKERTNNGASAEEKNLPNQQIKRRFR